MDFPFEIHFMEDAHETEYNKLTYTQMANAIVAHKIKSHRKFQ